MPVALTFYECWCQAPKSTRAPGKVLVRRRFRHQQVGDEAVLRRARAATIKAVEVILKAIAREGRPQARRVTTPSPWIPRFEAKLVRRRNRRHLAANWRSRGAKLDRRPDKDRNHSRADWAARLPHHQPGKTAWRRMAGFRLGPHAAAQPPHRCEGAWLVGDLTCSSPICEVRQHVHRGECGELRPLAWAKVSQDSDR